MTESNTSRTIEDAEMIINGLIGPLEEELGEYSFALIPSELRLRERFCGPASTVVAEALKKNDVAVETYIYRDMTRLRKGADSHVLDVINTPDGQYILDMTYSQFFDDFGLDPFIQAAVDDKDLYPDEKYLLFPADKVPEVALWAADVIRIYWKQNSHREFFHDRWRENMYPPIDPTRIDFNEIVDYFADKWDLNNYELLEPTDDYELSKNIAERIMHKATL